MNVQAVKRVLKSKKALLLLITVVVIAAFYFVNPNYLSMDSIRGTMQRMSITGIMALGIACLFISGGIDLASSSECLFGGVVCGLLIKSGIPWGWAVAATLAVGGVIGALNAFLALKIGLMPFISTIAISSVLQGINLGVTNAQNIPIPNPTFAWGSRNLFGILPIPFVIMIVLIIVYEYVLKRTQFGRNMYIVGGNVYAARLSGLNPDRILTVLYINNAVVSTLAGIVLASRMQSASPLSMSDSQMDAITAAILGGIAFYGGGGDMSGCLIGILLLNFFSSGLNMLALESYWTTIASGLLLIIALMFDYLNERAAQRALKVKTTARAAAPGEAK
ncbi:MAG: ABC transporter permease [Oscillospiraceae bacterium]|nr:ABC transporter permease [Oscillospiraceae bacterium]